MSDITAVDKLLGSTPLTEQKSALIRKTYLFLTLSIISAIIGGGACVYALEHSESFQQFFFSPSTRIVAYILCFVGINAVPFLALWASRQNMTLAIFFLILDGFLAGGSLGPILFVVKNIIESPMLIALAGGITGAVFLAITAFIFVSKKRFSAPKGLMLGIFISIIFGITASLIFPGSALLTGLITAGIGILGVCGLVYATSDILNNPDYNNPIQGALMLFAALFNIFVAVLRLLISLAGGGRNRN